MFNNFSEDIRLLWSLWTIQVYYLFLILDFVCQLIEKNLLFGNRSLICFLLCRSSHQRSSIKKGVLRNFTKFTGKHLCQSLFFNKVAGLRPATSLKKRLWRRCFPVNWNTSGRLLLALMNYVFHSSSEIRIIYVLSFLSMGPCIEVNQG